MEAVRGVRDGVGWEGCGGWRGGGGVDGEVGAALPERATPQPGEVGDGALPRRGAPAQASTSTSAAARALKK